MTNGLLVVTECPTCGAPLDFMEGSNAVQCSHCKSNLLVTGRKQVLSYFAAPKLDVHRAVARTLLIHKENGHPCRVVKPQLYFLPYYRLTGHDFRWEIKPREPQPPKDSFADYSTPYVGQNSPPSLFEMAGDILQQVFGNQKEMPSTSKNFPFPSLTPGNPFPVQGGQETALSKEREEVIFHDQYVEKNFIGCQFHESGMYSLGVRPAVLRLGLYGKTVLESLGKVVRADMTPDQAFSKGMKTVETETLLYRQVLGRMLSIVYFPFWVVEAERDGKSFLTLLDAVSESVVQTEAPLSLYEFLDKSSAEEGQTIQFRPLACPNCGWDLPVRPDDVIFFCQSCRKAWQIYGSNLSEVSYQAVVPSAGPLEGPVKYLPFWFLDSGNDPDPSGRFFLPAFRYRRLKFLADLAMTFFRKPPSFKIAEDVKLDSQGCFYDQEDAANLAKIAYAGLNVKSLESAASLQEDRFSNHKMVLTWVPFRIQGDSLFDPFSGLALSQNLLL